MTVARSPNELERRPRAVAIGSFDGVHLGHRRVLEAVQRLRRTPTAITFDPHPRAVLHGAVELLTTLERRLELLDAAGIEDVLVLRFDLAFSRQTPEQFVDRVLRTIGAEAVAGGETFRFGHQRSGDLALLRRLGFAVEAVPLAGGVSSSAIRAHLRDGEVADAAALLGRPAEIDGVVVHGDARGAGLGFPTANLRVQPDLLLPRDGVYAGSALGHRAAVSIGTAPHFGGTERRAEAYLLDYAGDLYGQRLVVQLWRRLRDQAAFADEDELVAQIARDVDEARAAMPPA